MTFDPSLYRDTTPPHIPLAAGVSYRYNTNLFQLLRVLFIIATPAHIPITPGAIAPG